VKDGGTAVRSQDTHDAMQAPASTEDPSAPAAILSAWADAYASQEGARSAALYTEDASLWGTASSVPSKGRAAIATYFDARRGTIARSSVAFDEQAVSLLPGGTAVIYGRYSFRQERLDGGEILLSARFSMTLVRDHGRWLIAHHHSSPMPQQL